MNRLFSAGNPATSEILKAKQYAAAALLQALVLAIIIFVNWQWGDVTLTIKGDNVTVGFLLYYARNIVLILVAWALVPAIYHFFLWNKKGRPHSDDDNNSLFSDWKGGERSPLKVALAFLGLTAFLMIALIVV